MQSADNKPAEGSSQEYFGLLDAIIVVAESWKLLLVGTILAVLGAVGYSQIQPRIYESTATLTLDGVQLARFSSPTFLERVSKEGETLNIDVMHGASTSGPGQVYTVTYQGSSPEAAQAGLTAVIEAFNAETAPDDARLEVLQRSRVRILQALDHLEAISSKLAGAAETTTPGSESELYTRSVVMLLDEQAKRQDELAAVDAELKRSASIVVTPPSLPAEPLAQSIRGTLIVAVGGATFLVLAAAFVREAFMRAAGTPSGLAKLRRLRRAFSLSRRN